jgi:transcription antitermination factor NusG
LHFGPSNSRRLTAHAELASAPPTRDRGDWFVLRTRSRQEKVLASDLHSNRIACFLPMLRTERTYCNRRITVELPMFPGYLFLRGSLDDAYWADRTRRVAQIIQVADQARLDCELMSLAQAIASDARLDPYPYLKKGVRVEIRSGPLRGLHGLIEDRARAHRIILQIEALGQAVSLEVDAGNVDVID